jgi:hypothetical protein
LFGTTAKSLLSSKRQDTARESYKPACCISHKREVIGSAPEWCVFGFWVTRRSAVLSTVLQRVYLRRRSCRGLSREQCVLQCLGETAPPAKWASWSGTAGRPGRRSSTGWCCAVQWRISSTEHPRFWADGPPLATRHDPQTTHRPEKCASNPTPVASNATPCTYRASY